MGDRDIYREFLHTIMYLGTASDEDDSFPCPHCGKQLKFREYCTYRSWKNVKNNFIDIDDNEPVWSFCPKCGYSFGVPEEME